MTLEELEETFMNGFADDVTGDTDSGPIGHVYRVGRYLVFTTSTGAHDVHEYDQVEKAVDSFNEYAAEYEEWESSDA